MVKKTSRLLIIAGSVLAGALPGLFLLHAQEGGEDPPDGSVEFKVEHPECTFFGQKRDQLIKGGLNGAASDNELGSFTTEIVKRLAIYGPGVIRESVPGGSRTGTLLHATSKNTIDKYLAQDWQAAGITPSQRTSDYEFIRRVTLDLTGRIPTPDRVVAFVSDSSPDKRNALIDELLAKPEFVDKWVMYFGDLFNNTTVNTATGVRRYPDGRNAFYTWLKQQISANRPYNQIAYDIISATGTNSYDPTQGQINWIVNGLVVNGPIQDAYDQQAANTAETFLGLAHMNCTLCHNGRGHLDALSVWGAQEARVTSWGFAAFFGRTVIKNTPVNAAQGNQPYYWSAADNGPRDYTLNTLTGNRPARCMNNRPPLTDDAGNLYCACTDGQPPLKDKNGLPVCKAAAATVSPVYPFNGHTPRPGESYRVAAAREITSDFLFAQATVNYLWKEFFGIGLVDPPNQLDPARLDPDNPPAAPWTLQASHPRLLNALAQDFINSGYDLKALMREMTSSDAYQLSAQYAGTAPPDNMFARKLVRRLWGEEVHDAIVQSSGVLPSYDITPFGKTPWAMQFPEPRGYPASPAAVQNFLDAFIRGNRDDEDRRSDGSLTQALGLMNDSFVVSRVKVSGSGATASLLAKSLPQNDEQLVNNLWLNVLSRYPTDNEKRSALAQLASGSGATGRQQKAEDLLWSLYNKVDFIFNY